MSPLLRVCDFLSALAIFFCLALSETNSSMAICSFAQVSSLTCTVLVNSSFSVFFNWESRSTSLYLQQLMMLSNSLLDDLDLSSCTYEAFNLLVRLSTFDCSFLLSSSSLLTILEMVSSYFSLALSSSSQPQMRSCVFCSQLTQVAQQFSFFALYDFSRLCASQLYFCLLSVRSLDSPASCIITKNYYNQSQSQHNILFSPLHFTSVSSKLPTFPSSSSHSIPFTQQITAYKLNLQQMPKTKERSAGVPNKTQPFNINIEFNINPKNITHHQQTAEMKFSQNVFQTNPAQQPRSKNLRGKKAANWTGEGEASERERRRREMGSCGTAEMNVKRLQKMKKNLIGKINNMDIIIAEPVIYPQENRCQSDERSSSIMSAKLAQYEGEDSRQNEEKGQFRLNGTAGKSKILENAQISKALGVDNFKKHKSQYKSGQKKGLHRSVNKLESKLLSHQRGFSNFTEVKSARTSKKKRMSLQPALKRSQKPKQVNLKQKLEKFKLDMMKLVNYYEENEVLKTKISSEYYQMRSREISKDIVEVKKITQGEEHQKLGEIKEFLAKQPREKIESEEFMKLKQMYEEFRNKQERQERNEEIVCTENLIEYYRQLSYDPEDEDLIDEEEIVQPAENLNLMSSIRPIEIGDDFSDESEKVEAQSIQENKLEEFVAFIIRKLPNSQSASMLKQNISNIYRQFVTNEEESITYSVELKDEQARDDKLIEKEQSSEPSVDISPVVITNLDEAINREIGQLPQLKQEILEGYSLQQNETESLEIWENSYKMELLKVKKRMWKEYNSIRNIVENRIVSNKTDRPIQTIRAKKHKKIMKCLSQKLLPSKSFLRIQSQPDEEWKPTLTRQKEPNYFSYGESQKPLPTINHDSSGQESEQGDETDNSRVVYFQPAPSSIFNAESNELLSQISDTCQIEQQMVSKSKSSKSVSQSSEIKIELSPVKMSNATVEDKEDVFEFIFLDLCIEIYQDLIERERSSLTGKEDQELRSAERVMGGIRNYLKEEKKRAKNKEMRRIGISTNFATVKKVTQEVIDFLTSGIVIAGATVSNRKRVLAKLNTPLGPAQLQILKSLRLSVFENESGEQYPDDYQDNDLLVLQSDLFLFFQNDIIKVKELPFNRYYESEEKDNQRVNFLRNCTHIHHKAIFDCLNQNLDYLRVYGIWGKPFLWKRGSTFNHPKKDCQLEKILSKAMGQVMRCTTFACGLMVNKQQSLLKDLSAQSQYVRQLQDQRIYKLLQNFVGELEQKWFFHDDEEAQILIEVSHLVWTILIKQFLHEYVNLRH